MINWVALLLVSCCLQIVTSYLLGNRQTERLSSPHCYWAYITLYGIFRLEDYSDYEWLNESIICFYSCCISFCVVCYDICIDFALLVQSLRSFSDLASNLMIDLVFSLIDMRESSARGMWERNLGSLTLFLLICVDSAQNSRSPPPPGVFMCSRESHSIFIVRKNR